MSRRFSKTVLIFAVAICALGIASLTLKAQEAEKTAKQPETPAVKKPEASEAKKPEAPAPVDADKQADKVPEKASDKEPEKATDEDPDKEADKDEDVVTLNRGPVHEAFAEQVNYDPKPGLVVPKAPPEPVKELPPEIQPDKPNIAWIPGYWGWDDDKEDYIWVSGTWRVPPPGQRWVHGYWTKIKQTDDTEAYQWVSGFWSPADSDDLNYRPAPPDSLEAGPSSPAPGSDYYWVPGSWVYTNGSYVWRPGFWSAYQADWVWIPARYIWTPRGCLYRGGYWDYPLANRGYLFAPCWYRRPLYLNSGYYYSPWYSMGFMSLNLHLFIRPNYCHYYFGNYYGANYGGRFYHCSNFQGHYRGYDAFYAHNQIRYQHMGLNYGQHMGGWHNYFTQHPNMQPPRTAAGQQVFAAHHAGHAHLSQSLIGNSFTQATNSHNVNHLSQTTRQTLATSAGQMQNSVTQHRQSSHTLPAPATGGAGSTGVVAANHMGRQTLHLPHDASARSLSHSSNNGVSHSMHRSTGSSSGWSGGSSNYSRGYSGGGFSSRHHYSGGGGGMHHSGGGVGHHSGGGHSGGHGGGGHGGGGHGGGGHH